MDEKIARARDAITRADKLLVFTGAGISKESGVPTFREADGLWEKFKAEDFATLESFKKRPQEVWKWYRERRSLARKAKPNPAHIAVAKLDRLHWDFMIATQNIDNLHRRAGAKRVLELHGNLLRSYCLECGKKVDESDADLDGEVPICSEHGCGGLMRPDVVWFGEYLDPNILNEATRFASECDCCIVVGTSGLVYPAAQLPYLAKRNDAAIIEINPEPSAITGIADYFFEGKAGEMMPVLVEHIKEG